MSVRLYHDEPAGRLTGRALLLPGAHYDVRRHGLFWPTRTLLDKGWLVTRAEWDGDEWGDEADGFIRDVVERLAAEAPPAPRTVIVGKSVGSLAIPWAAERGLPGIWLTPLLHLDHIRTALAQEPRSLLVGGTADESWTPDAMCRERHQLVEVDGMDHGMFVGTGWRDTFAAMTTILESIERFLEA
jgi:hypothetical protein